MEVPTMTDVAAIGGAVATDTQGSKDIFNGLGPDAFLQLLVTQMRYQNPLSPSDPTAMMGQLASYAQVESLQNLQKGQAATATLTEAKLATDMVGKYVDAADASGTTASGLVVAARFTTDGPVLVLDNGGELTLSAITRVATGSTPLTTPVDTTTPATTPATTPSASTDDASGTPSASDATTSSDPAPTGP
jgi:flagellar basal-body rod modification protein FlgD